MEMEATFPKITKHFKTAEEHENSRACGAASDTARMLASLGLERLAQPPLGRTVPRAQTGCGGISYMWEQEEELRRAVKGSKTEMQP